MGVASSRTLYSTVPSVEVVLAAADRRRGAGSTPVAALMFLQHPTTVDGSALIVAAVRHMVRATETASTRWIALAGCAVGFAIH
jgi:hypothetical protein